VEYEIKGNHGSESRAQERCSLKTTLALRATNATHDQCDSHEQNIEEADDLRLSNEPSANPIPRSPLDQFRNLEILRNLQPTRIDEYKVSSMRDGVR